MTGGAPNSGKVRPGTHEGSVGLHLAGSALPLEFSANIRFTPWRPAVQLMIPEAELPAPVPWPWTNVHGRPPVHRLSPAVYPGVQSVAAVPSALNSIPPQVLAATPRTQAHARPWTSIFGKCTEAAATTAGITPFLALPTTTVSPAPANGKMIGPTISLYTTVPLVPGTSPPPETWPSTRFARIAVSLVQLPAQPSPPCGTQCRQFPPGQS